MNASSYTRQEQLIFFDTSGSSAANWDKKIRLLKEYTNRCRIDRIELKLVAFAESYNLVELSELGLLKPSGYSAVYDSICQYINDYRPNPGDIDMIIISDLRDNNSKKFTRDEMLDLIYPYTQDQVRELVGNAGTTKVGVGT